MFNTPEQAKRHAIMRRNDNDGLNTPDPDYTPEWAYSPQYCTVGHRNFDGDNWRIINTNYPMYGRSEHVADWVSVGCERPKGVKSRPINQN